MANDPQRPSDVVDLGYFAGYAAGIAEGRKQVGEWLMSLREWDDDFGWYYHVRPEHIQILLGGEALWN